MSGYYCEDHFTKIEKQIELLVQAQAQFQAQFQAQVQAQLQRQAQLQLQAQQQQNKQSDLNVNVANTGSIDLVLVAVLVRLAFGANATSEEATNLMNQAIEASNKSREEMVGLVKALVAK